MVTRGSYYLVNHEKGTYNLEILSSFSTLKGAKEEKKKLEERGDNYGNKYSNLNVVRVMN